MSVNQDLRFNEHSHLPPMYTYIILGKKFCTKYIYLAIVQLCRRNIRCTLTKFEHTYCHIRLLKCKTRVFIHSHGNLIK